MKNKKFDLVVLDRREPPPVLVEVLSELMIPIVGFDLKSHLQIENVKNKKLVKDYSKAVAKIDYVVNSIPSLERPWANLYESKYLLSPFFLDQNNNLQGNPQIQPVKKLWFYVGQITEVNYLKHTLSAIVRFLVLYREEVEHIFRQATPKKEIFIAG